MKFLHSTKENLTQDITIPITRSLLDEFHSTCLFIRKKGFLGPISIFQTTGFRISWVAMSGLFANSSLCKKTDPWHLRRRHFLKNDGQMQRKMTWLLFCPKSSPLSSRLVRKKGGMQPYLNRHLYPCVLSYPMVTGTQFIFSLLNRLRLVVDLANPIKTFPP